MKKFKKIICLALAMVMMMAMSTVAFAANDATLTVNGLKNDAEVSVYKVASVNYKNEIVKETWAENAYPIGSDGKIVKGEVDITTQMSATQVSALKEAFENSKPPVVKSATAKDESVSFTGLEAGVYYIVATSSEATYSPMVAVAITVDEDGNYVGKTETVTAKGTDSDLDKKADDEFVYAGEEVVFTITKTIPSFVNKFVIYDYTKNLSSLDNVEATVKYAGEDHTYNFAAVSNADNKFALDLTDIVYDVRNDSFINDNAGKTLTITYKATVIGNAGYENKATYSTNDNDETGTVEVKGFEGDITLTKTGTDGAKLEGAKFTLSKDDKVLTFTWDAEKNVYVYDKNSTNKELVTDAEGLLKVTGLDEGTYQFTETEAPEGYSINTDIDSVTISDKDAEGNAVVENVSEELPVVDSTLVRLPFTGGMGTTIFTVLGVAIMVIAAALYFASKKSAKN